MQPLDELKRLLVFNPVLSLDLETKAPEGRPASEALDTSKAQLYIVAMAAGRGATMKSFALPPDPDVLAFVKESLENPNIRVVGHNLINYDIEVLHYRGVVQFENIAARLVDTLPLVWLIDERKETDRGLKASAKRFLGVNMTTFEDAFISSPNALEIHRLQTIRKSVQKGLEERKKTLRQQRLADKKRLVEELENKYRDKRDRESRAEKKSYAIKIKNYLEITYGEPALKIVAQSVSEELVRIDQRISDLEKAWEYDKKAYAEDDARRSLQLYGRVRHVIRERGLLDWADIEIKNKIVCTAMELNGMPVDVQRLGELDQEFTPLIQEMEAKLFDMAKCEFNPRSPKQLEELIFDTLNVPPVKETVRVVDPDTGEVTYEERILRDTNEKTLARIDHPFIQALLNYRAVQKLHSTYVRSLLETAMLDPEQRIHARFNSTGTVTGRYASHGPNLQNIPSRSKPKEYDERVQDLGPRIRWVFAAPPGRKLICADLSQIELRLITQVTGDDKLLRVYNEYVVIDGIKYYTGDIHANTAKALNVPRKLAKNLNFGCCYGIGAPKFARYARLFKPGTREWDVKAAGVAIDMFMGLYQGIPATIDYLQELIDGVHTKRPVRSFRLMTGRYRHFSKREKLYGGKALNSVIQGSAADLLKIIMWYVYDTLRSYSEFEGSKITLQVHDEIGLDVPAELAEKVGIMVKYIMERAWFRLDVPVIASVKVCDDWSGKDDDDVPEVGHFYAKLRDGNTVTERIFTPDNWREYVEFEKAAKKDKDAKKPEAESKEVLAKAAVAMLTPEQESWAAQFLPEVPCYSV